MFFKSVDARIVCAPIKAEQGAPVGNRCLLPSQRMNQRIAYLHAAVSSLSLTIMPDNGLDNFIAIERPAENVLFLR